MSVSTKRLFGIAAAGAAATCALGALTGNLTAEFAAAGGIWALGCSGFFEYVSAYLNGDNDRRGVRQYCGHVGMTVAGAVFIASATINP